MSVMTVRGPLDAGELGVTLAHEHLFLDLTNEFHEPADPELRPISHEPMSLAYAGLMQRNPYGIRDNLLLDDVSLAVEEVARFQALGGKSLVECTSIGICPEPLKLREVAERTGLQIIAGCGYYTQDTHPESVRRLAAEKLAERILADLTEGIGGTDVRAGVIGEIGTSTPIHPDEEKCLRAAALAFRQVPVPLYVHTYPWGQDGLKAAELLLEMGVEANKIVICHVDVEFHTAYLRALLERGLFVEFDDFGKEFDTEAGDRSFAGGPFARDSERVRAVKDILEWGYGDQLLLTTDICLKSLLHAFGGNGYEHVLARVAPMLREEGIPQETIDALLIANPKRLFDS